MKYFNKYGKWVLYLVLVAVVVSIGVVGIFNPTEVSAKGKYHLWGWRVDQDKWMEGLLWTYYENDWAPYRLAVEGYVGVETDIGVQHDYLDADGDYGIDGARNFFIGPLVDRDVAPADIPVLYNEGTIFHVVSPPTIVPVPNGSMIEYHIIVDDPAALTALGTFAFYWEAHCSLTNSIGVTFGETVEFGSSYWNGASLHTHTSITGNQDVPIRTPPVAGPSPIASIDVEKYVSVDYGVTWLDADTAGDAPEKRVTNNLKYKYVVTNTGQVPLINITLSDFHESTYLNLSHIMIIDPLPAGGTFEGFYGLEPPYIQALEGLHTNTATATGDYAGVTYMDSDDANYIGNYTAPH